MRVPDAPAVALALVLWTMSTPASAQEGGRVAPAVWNGRGASFQVVNRYRDNPEIRLDRAAASQFQPIVLLERRVKAASQGEPARIAQGTGFLIGPCLMVTNHHVVYDDQPGAPSDAGGRVRLGLGYAGPSRFTENLGGQSVASGAVDADDRHDWTVVRVNSCPGRRFGWYPAARTSTADLVKHHMKVFVVSFPGDRAQGDLSLSYGEVMGENPVNGTMQYSSSTAAGSSGGAIFVYERGKMRLVGINKSGVKNEYRDRSGRLRFVDYVFDTYAKQNTNYFINAREVFCDPAVRKLLRADLRDNHMANPLERQLSSPPPQYSAAPAPARAAGGRAD